MNTEALPTTLEDVAAFAAAYAGLGWAVTEQADDIIAAWCAAHDEDMFAVALDDLHEDGKLNANAVRMVAELLADHGMYDIAGAIKGWLA